MIDVLRQYRVVPVASVPTVDDGLKMCEALLQGGLPLIEITFRTSAAEASIAAAVQRFPEMLVGAGTLLDVTNVQRAAGAGARFAVAPGCSPAVVQAARERGLAFFPGIATPTEVEQALGLGAKILKFFPAEAIGGVKLLKALEAPYAHLGVQFIPTGGISATNMKAYFELKSVAAVGGSWMVEKKLVADKDWAGITRLAREAVALAKG